MFEEDQEGTDPEPKPKDKSYYDQILEAAKEAEAWWEAKRSGTEPGEDVPPPAHPPPESRPTQDLPEGGLVPLLTEREKELLDKHGRDLPIVTEPGEDIPWRFTGKGAVEDRPQPGTPGYEDFDYMEWQRSQPHYGSEEEADEAERSGLDQEIRRAMEKDRRIRLMNPPQKHGEGYGGPQYGGGIVPISHQPSPPRGDRPGLTSGHLSAEPAFTPEPPPKVEAPVSLPPTPKAPLWGKGGELTDEGEKSLRDLYKKREGLQEF